MYCSLCTYKASNHGSLVANEHSEIKLSLFTMCARSLERSTALMIANAHSEEQYRWWLAQYSAQHLGNQQLLADPCSALNCWNQTCPRAVPGR